MVVRAIKFTREELKWIERTADMESARAMFSFTKLVNETDIKKLDKKEKEMVKNMTKELIELYIFLKDLRVKLELWDCRYDINKGFEVEDAKDKKGVKKK